MLFYIPRSGFPSIPEAMQQLEFHNPSTNPLTNRPRKWVTLEPGIDQLTLNADPSTGRATYLQRWAPNIQNEKQNFVHDYVEEIIILEGDLRDLRGRRSGTGELLKDGDGGNGEVWVKGSYAYRKPGMEHGLFGSGNGCLMFIVCIPVGKV